MNEKIPRAALLFIIAVAVLGILSITDSAKNFTYLSTRDRIGLLAFVLFVLLSDIYRVQLFMNNMNLSMSTVATFGAILLFPKQCAIVAIAAFLSDVIIHKPIIKSVFNGSQWAVTTFVSGQVWYILRNQTGDSYILTPQELSNTKSILIALCCALVYLLINTSLVGTIVSITENVNIMHVISTGLSGIIVQFLIQPALGLLIAILYTLNPISIVLVISPLAAVYYSLRNFDHLRKQTLKTIERLSDILDRRDPQTDQHSIRVAHYVRLICEELGLPSELTESIVSAARVHDLGKIGIPDAVLLKPGKLTDEEWELIRKHPEYGEDILSPLSAYEECLPAIRHHHERWDGMGYPDGLAGEDIPLGARIIAVADTYDAMVSSRPYRKGADKPDALLEIRRQAGKQFDPKVVEAFLKVMENRAEVAMPISINVAFDKQANT